MTLWQLVISSKGNCSISCASYIHMHVSRIAILHFCAVKTQRIYPYTNRAVWHAFSYPLGKKMSKACVCIYAMRVCTSVYVRTDS